MIPDCLRGSSLKLDVKLPPDLEFLDSLPKGRLQCHTCFHFYVYVKVSSYIVTRSDQVTYNYHLLFRSHKTIGTYKSNVTHDFPPNNLYLLVNYKILFILSNSLNYSIMIIFTIIIVLH